MSDALNSFYRRPSKVWLALLAALAWLTSLPAQPVPPALLLEGAQHPTPLAITKVDVDARIFGFVAETRMTLVFRNRLNRPVAGDLYFPLPVGATVSGYALDVNGTMVDGVAVEKDKGRQVFEKEMRKGVDPGLLEWTRGNCFKTRVFPIPANGTRTVRVSYLSEVLTDAKGSHYQLPLHFKEKLAQFHLRLEVVQAQARPVLQPGGPANLKFGKWRQSYLAETRHTNASLPPEILIDLPQVEQQRVLVEKAGDGHYYFCVNDFPADPRPAPKKLTLPPLSQVTLFWDASGSRGASDHQRELAWLKTWFATYSRFSMAVNLVPFRNALAPIQRFVVTNGEASTLLNAIAKLDYDGGTQIGCLTNFPAPAPGGCYFLFSDGLGNFGRSEPPAFNAPLYAFAADQTVDQPCLQCLAQRSGGALFQLPRMTDREVLVAMAGRPFSFLNAESGGPGTAELYPRLARPLSKRFTLVGKLTAAEAPLVLNYGAGGKTLARSKVTLSRANAVEGNLLRRLWAQKKLEDLLVFQKHNQREILDLGKEYSLVTPLTSLLVLENLDQYVEHRVLPPASLPRLRAQYARILEERALSDKKENKDKTEHLLALWNQRVDWWNKKFEYPKNLPASRNPAEPIRLPGQAYVATNVVPLPDPAMRREAWARNAQVADLAAAEVRLSSAAAAPAPVVASPPAMVASSPPAPARELRPAESEPGIALKEWDPNTPYLQALKQAPPQTAFAVYLAQRKNFGASPAFYLDCAEFFRKQKQDGLSLQILSNLAELELENAPLLRVLAYRLMQLGQVDLAAGLFEQVLKLRPEEPQSFRDLALALAKRAQCNQNPADCRRALDLLAQVVSKQWDRFDEIEVIALMELNSLWADFTRRFPNEKLRFPVDARLQKLLDLDLRIVLTWDADMTDIDLHVTEPSGEVAMYNHNLTLSGGLVSKDFTQGYGPEEYCLHQATHGTYKIEANYYGSQALQLMGPVTVQAEVITHFGRPNEKRKSLTLRLAEKKETVLVGEVEF